MRSSIFLLAALSATIAASAPSAATIKGRQSAVDPNQEVSDDLATVLQTKQTGMYQYPTDLTRNIAPKAIHSHNDYWRDLPFYTALAAGCISIEADIWEINGTLYIGHELSALESGRTLDSVYIQPILSVLKRQNPNTAFASNTKNGVFDTSSGQTLYLFIDVKTNGTITWPYAVAALEPLRAAGYLTTWNGTGVTTGPVTVVGTGNTPYANFSTNASRDYFYDAPLALLTEEPYNNITYIQSPIASTDFEAAVGSPANGSNGFNATQLATMKSQIAEAKSRGIAARYWDTPAWPTGTRNLIWTTLVDLGVGLLNADSLDEAAGLSDRGGFW